MATVIRAADLDPATFDWKVDGKVAPAIAKGNTIRRDVALDGDKLLAGTAVPDQSRPAVTAPPPPPGSGG